MMVCIFPEQKLGLSSNNYSILPHKLSFRPHITWKQLGVMRTLFFRSVSHNGQLVICGSSGIEPKASSCLLKPTKKLQTSYTKYKKSHSFTHLESQKWGGHKNSGTWMCPLIYVLDFDAIYKISYS